MYILFSSNSVLRFVSLKLEMVPKLMLAIFLFTAFQPVIHEPLSNPDFLQNAVNGDIALNGGTSNGSPEHAHEQQGIVINFGLSSVSSK